MLPKGTCAEIREGIPFAMVPIEPNNIAPLSLRPGNVLRAKYRVERVLGAGGMGIVVLATHLRMSQRVAIKLLRAEAPNRGDLVQRFAREARAASKLRGEHTVRILDVDDSDEGEPFLVMEYLEGKDLQAMLAEKGPFPVDEAVGYVLQACEGIAEAHALGIVHRDLKPANLFVTRRADGTPIVKILDFGISRAIEPDAPGAHAITRPEAALGSPSYMSPEQLKDAASAGLSTDLWALGVVLYQLLSGSLPFEATTAASLAARIASDPHKPLLKRRPEIPSGIVEAIDRCLDKDPTKRFADAAALALALAPFAPGGESGAMRTARVTEEQSKRARTSDAPPSPALPIPAPGVTPNVTVSLHGEPPAGSAQKLIVTEYSSSVAASAPEQTSRPAKSRLPLFLASAAIVVVLIVGVGLLSTWNSTSNVSVRSPGTGRSTDTSTGPERTLVNPTPNVSVRSPGTGRSTDTSTGPERTLVTSTSTSTELSVDAGRRALPRPGPRKPHNPMDIEFR